MCPEKLSELGGLSELSVPKLTDLYCIKFIKQTNLKCMSKVTKCCVLYTNSA